MSMQNPFGLGAVDLAAHMAAKAAATPATDDLTKGIDVYDSEVLEIEKVLNTLKARSRDQMRNYSDFDREVKERFSEIGFYVDVLWYDTNVETVKMPEIVIKGVTDARAFDREQMTHEVTNDILGLGDGGVIKTDKDKVLQMMDGTYKGNASGVHQH